MSSPGRRVLCADDNEDTCFMLATLLGQSGYEAVAAHDAEALGLLLAEDCRFDLDARRMLTKAPEIEAVKASDAFLPH